MYEGCCIASAINTKMIATSMLMNWIASGRLRSDPRLATTSPANNGGIKAKMAIQYMPSLRPARAFGTMHPQRVAMCFDGVSQGAEGCGQNRQRTAFRNHAYI